MPGVIPLFVYTIDTIRHIEKLFRRQLFSASSPWLFVYIFDAFKYIYIDILKVFYTKVVHRLTFYKFDYYFVAYTVLEIFHFN